MAAKSLHIAQICASRSWGGLEMHVAVLSGWLAESGYSVEIYCAPGSPLAEEALRRGLAVVPFAPAGYLDMLAAWRLYRQLRRRGADIIHAHSSKDLWIIAPVVRFARRWPLVFVKHIGTARPKRDFLHRWIYASVDRVIAISRVIESNVLATHPVEAGRVSIIYHGVDTRNFVFHPEARARVRREWGIAPEEILIGTIGRLQIGKGHLEFLDMAAALDKRYPQARFVIVGEPTRGEEHRAEPILARMRSLGLESRIIMPGFRQDVPDILAAIDIFAFPSRAEAFGLVLIEAMAIGRAVVSTRCDGVLDIVQDGQNGLMFDPEQPQEFINQVERLILDEQFRARLGQNGLATVSGKFSREKMLEQLFVVYNQALEQHMCKS